MLEDFRLYVDSEGYYFVSKCDPYAQDGGGTMANGESEHLRKDAEHLRILIANERPERLDLVTRIVHELGHQVIARELDVADVADVTRKERPDVALVGLGESSTHALQMIEQIVREAASPVIALLEVKDSDFVNEAAKRGIFAYITDTDADGLQSALDIVLRRFAEYHNLEGAFGRRATIERAKGILMAIHSIDEQRAFEMLRTQSQHRGRKLVDLAEAVAESHQLLVPPPKPPKYQDA
jgi:AmiR/NasT family two-component response regulator